MSNITNLFPIPLYQTTVEIDDFSIDLVKTLEYERIVHNNGWISKNIYVLNEPMFSLLKTVVDNHVQDFIEKLYVRPHVELELQNSWVIKHETGDYGQIHNHTNSIFSGVLYLQVDEDSGRICFLKMHDNIFQTSLDPGFTVNNELTSQQWCVSPKRGSLVIFPSHLYHRIEHSESDQERYCIAFNYYLRGTIYCGEEYNSTGKVIL